MLFRLCSARNFSVRISLVVSVLVFLLVLAASEMGFAQTPPLTIFKNFFVTGDYVVGGWVEQSSANGLATGTISIPDCTQAAAMGAPCPSAPPAGADIVAAYLYWGTVEGSQSLFAGQQAFFNGYKIIGDVLGDPNAPTSWSSGGCTGSSTGSKTMRMYRADVRPYLPLDLSSSPMLSPTFGALKVNPSVVVKIADSGSNGNTQPNALGATLVLIYRVLSPSKPLNAIVLYDGSYAPSNAMQTMTQNIVGFYQPDQNPSARITHIVANGQINKGETVYFGPGPQSLTMLPSLYTLTLGSAAPPFPGIYGAWDNPTWDVGSNRPLGNLMNVSGLGFGSQTTSVVPTSSNSGCVNWGAIVFSTTVQDTDKDGLLDVWENNGSYLDVVNLTNGLPTPVALPGADPWTKDLFVELDYLTLRNGSNNVLHSHLPKKAALDAVGDAFSAQGIKVHFDLPPSIYSGDQYVISTGAGDNEIPESSLVCTDGVALCAFPNQAAVSWKGDFEAVKSNPALGKFQAGRAQSYKYALFGHALGDPRSYWGAVSKVYVANDPQDFQSSLSQLDSIVVNGGTATVTLKSPSLISGAPPLFPPLVLKPGDCSVAPPAQPPAACSDGNADRVTISGSLAAPILPADSVILTPHAGTPPLNGTYIFSNASSSAADGNGMITTTFQITTPGVPDGTYQFNCDPNQPTNPPCVADPQLGVSYLGPTSSSGHSDFGGGGDLAVMLGLWGADNAAGCQADPSQPLNSGQVYCDDQVGTVNVQTGTLMHELGHTLTLTHGGTYYQVGSSIPTYEGNCKPNFISIMNYLFQVRGFVDDNPFKFDYSGQSLPALNEAALSESQGVNSGSPAQHLTRWYSMPNPAFSVLGEQALAHCDGSPIATGEQPGVRVDGSPVPPLGGTIPTALDWNNDLIIPDTVLAPGEDLNHNGAFNDTPFLGFDDWHGNPITAAGAIDLQQTNARASGFGFSEGGGVQSKGGGVQSKGGGIDNDGAGLQSKGGGVQSKGGGVQSKGGGVEQDTETANSTVSAPSGLTCTKALTTTGGTTVPACTGSSSPFQEKGKAIPLSWTSPGFGQIRSYTVWRAIGSFPTMRDVALNIGKFAPLSPTLTGTPPGTSFIDTFQLKSNTTYTYFVTDSNKFGAKSGASSPLVVLLKF